MRLYARAQHLSLRVCTCLRMDKCYHHLWKCALGVGWNSAPECQFKWTQTSIAGQPLMFPTLLGDTATHMLHPRCICGVLMTSRLLILSACLPGFYFFNYLFSLLLKRYANWGICMCVYVWVSGLCECSTGHFSLANGYNFIGYGHYHGCSRVMWPHIITIDPVLFSSTF